MELLRRRLGRTGEEVTALGLGGEGILRTFGRPKEARRVIMAALESGIRYFESARAYSGSEAYLGEGLRGVREQIFLTSKSHGRSRSEAEVHLHTTLGNLQTDHLDLWQVHDLRTREEVEAIGAPGGALEAFYRAREQGKTRFIGVTGHHDPEILRLAIQMYDFDTVLLPVNPAETHHASFLPVAQEAADQGVGVVGMKVLCRGLLPQLFEGSLPLLVHYALSQPVDVIVIGADTVTQVQELAQAAADFEPQPAELQRRLEEACQPYAQKVMYYKP
ncbi:MAG: aldo/keto reductase [Deltaproteobacteria bacterium]|nr:aldo/keto reductase [Deltaproteobacteria bacterium]